MSGEREECRRVAIELAFEVGERIRETLGDLSLTVEKKGPRDLVTAVDLWAEHEITTRLERCFPHHRVVGEERVSQMRTEGSINYGTLLSGDHIWVIDPIDGTTNFVNGIPQVAVSLALLERGERVLGVVFDPIRKELFTAMRGRGALLNERPISVGSRDEILDAVVATGFPYDRATTWSHHRGVFESVLLTCRDIRRFGAATLDQCWVACGRLDAFFEEHLQPWDVAAASLIVEEAGGRSGHCRESGPFSLSATSFLFANRLLYDKLRNLFVQHGIA